VEIWIDGVHGPDDVLSSLATGTVAAIAPNSPLRTRSNVSREKQNNPTIREPAFDPKLNRAIAQALNLLLDPPDTILRSTFLSHPLISDPPVEAQHERRGCSGIDLSSSGIETGTPSTSGSIPGQVLTRANLADGLPPGLLMTAENRCRQLLPSARKLMAGVGARANWVIRLMKGAWLGPQLDHNR
jgi:hypothetical protein